MTDSISNSEDIIDSRDVIARIKELEAIRDAHAEDDNEPALDDDETAELKALQELASEAEGYAPDWTYGETLIRESYFTQYAEELLKDCGDLPRDIPHYIEIDWEKTARNILVDYTAVDFDGVTYYIR